jgi:hypothetical protein
MHYVPYSIYIYLLYTILYNHIAGSSAAAAMLTENKHWTQLATQTAGKKENDGKNMILYGSFT